jgi:hypothetical protein
VAARLERLILAINRTNGQATLADGRTLTTAIARRDVLRMRQGATDALLRSVGSPQFRARGAEIKFVPTVSVPELQVRRDALAKEYRELDTLETARDDSRLPAVPDCRDEVNKNSANTIWNGMALRIDRDSPGKICHTLGCTPGDLLEFVGRPTDEGRA